MQQLSQSPVSHPNFCVSEPQHQTIPHVKYGSTGILLIHPHDMFKPLQTHPYDVMSLSVSHQPSCPDFSEHDHQFTRHLNMDMCHE